MSENTSISAKEFFSSGGGFRWWAELTEQGEQPAHTPNRRGERAELRRCRTIDDVLLTPAYHRLRVLKNDANVAMRDDRLALIAGIVAHIDETPSKWTRPGQAMAQPSDGSDRAVVSGLRFRRLLQLDELDELLRALKRTVKLANGRFTMPALATDLAYWGQGIRKQWAEDYYAIALKED